MKESSHGYSGSSTSRAWQVLPRHLRRRAASHDVRRVPIRLREKARAEVASPAVSILLVASSLSRWTPFGREYWVVRCLNRAKLNVRAVLNRS
jgi:hypothetical protein